MKNNWEKGAAAYAAAPGGKSFLSEITIHHVRHLHNIVIPLSKDEPKTLILTGENGSGKSSVLEALYEYLKEHTSSSTVYPGIDIFSHYMPDNMSVEAKWNAVDDIGLNEWECFPPVFFDDDRKLGEFYTTHNKHSNYDLKDLLYKMRYWQKEYTTSGDLNKANNIRAFFKRFNAILRRLFDDDTLRLKFDRREEYVTILTKNRDPFGFDTLARGYSAIMEVISVLICLLDCEDWNFFSGVVLIDEIEVHLHVALQKKFLPVLTELFPNFQFIVTTHSPFVLASAKNAVVYDLEHGTLAADGLANIPYSGIVEGYFKVGEISEKLERELDEYRTLAAKKEWTDRDYADAERLEMDLDSVPDFLAGAWKAEYSRLKLEIAADKGE